MAHPSLPRFASGTAGKCPFRAALQAQSQSLHTSPSSTTSTSPPAPIPNKGDGKAEKGVATGGGNECKCVAEGLRPKGLHCAILDFATPPLLPSPSNVLHLVFYSLVPATNCPFPLLSSGFILFFPAGNCPFRWSDFITNTVKESVRKTFTPAPKAPQKDEVPITGMLVWVI